MSKDHTGKVLVWRLSDGELLPNQPIPDASQLTDKIPDPLIQAIPRGTDILLIRKNPNYDPWKEDAERRKKLSPQWHADDAAQAEEAKNWYTAAFHLGWLLQDNPDDTNLKQRYDTALAKLKEQDIPPPRKP